MSLFNDDRYTWRETYFVLLGDLRRRPLLDELRQALRPYRRALKILDATTNAEGRLRTLTVASYEDHSALEIVFRHGTEVADEVDGLVQMLEKECTPREKECLRTVKQCSAKFDVIHFEQTAGTAAFNVVKLPVLKFSPPPSDAKRRDSFSTKHGADRLGGKSATGSFARRPQFRFDPNSYENCLAGGTGDEYVRKIDEADDSGVFERVDPDTLILVLETLCRLTGGIAVDPASGTFFR